MRTPSPLVATVAVLVGLVLVGSAVAASAPPVTAGDGAGVFAFTSSADVLIDLADAGNYYLAVASDAGTSDAAILYNGTVLGEVNTTGSEANLVTLPAGNLTVRLAGSGRAALGIDFTNGFLRTFPAGGSLVAFVAPPSPVLDVAVHPGDASRVLLSIYDHALRLAWNGTFSADGTAAVDFGGVQGFVILVAESTTTRAGLFGLSWSVPPGPGPVDPLLLFAAGFVLAVALAAVVLLVLGRRRRRR